MLFKTKTLAIRSIQQNMVGVTQEKEQIFVSLATNYLMLILCPTEENATEIFNALSYYCVPRANNSVDLEFEFTYKLYALGKYQLFKELN